MIEDANQRVGKYVCARYGCHVVSAVSTEMGAMCLEHSSPLFFAIQYPYHHVGPGPCLLPWLFVKPHERQAQINHFGQTLARLSERGGLSVRKTLAVLQDRKWAHDLETMTLEVAVVELEKRLKEWLCQVGLAP